MRPSATPSHYVGLEFINKRGPLSTLLVCCHSDCWGNAVAESFFSTLEFECVRGVFFESHRALVFAISDYVDGFYNPQRAHATAGCISPIEAELAFIVESQAA